MPMVTAIIHQHAVNQPVKVMVMARAMARAMAVRKNPTKALQPHLKSQILSKLPPARKAALLQPDIAKHSYLEFFTIIQAEAGIRVILF